MAPGNPSTDERRAKLTIAEAIHYTGLSDKTIRRYIKAGRLTGYRVGPRIIKLDPTELDELLDGQPISAQSA